jgi:hypothetical protein
MIHLAGRGWAWLPGVLVAILGTTAYGQDAPIELLQAGLPRGGWSFGNGPEFPGAKGELELDPGIPDPHKPALRFSGDFTGGGAYIQATIDLPPKPARELSFWVKAPGSERLTLRLVDGSDQCHQIGLRLKKTDDWQEVRFPFKEFFARMGEGTSIDTVAQYEKWGGANDSRWHDPGKLVAVLAGAHNFPGTKKGAIWLSQIRLGLDRPTVRVEKTVRLDDLLGEGELDWTLSLGEEFPGAKGTLDLAKDEPEKGSRALHLRADFSGGGAYIAALRSLRDLGGADLRALRFRMRSGTVHAFSIRLVDATGQCHQKKALPFTADGAWHEVTLVPRDLAGGEHWGGANDGKWHGPATDVALLLMPAGNPEGKTSEALLAGLVADVTLEARARAEAYREGFEGAEALPKGWTAQGSVAVTRGTAWKGSSSLLLERSLDRVREETGATGAVFPASAGVWTIQGAAKSDLKSPDNSYNGTITLEALDPAGKVQERFEIRTAFGGGDWQPFEKSVELPDRTAGARFRIELRKTTGSLWVDELSAARVASDEKRVDRIILWADRLGNLFFPEDHRTMHVQVESVKPLREGERAVRYAIHDYWGAEQAPAARKDLVRAGRSNGRFVYTADLELDPVPLEVGRYYEMHVEVLSEGRPATETSGLAVLPTAPSKSLKPEDVPFTIRNWDSRIPDYFLLADRLGIRQLGLWAGWEASAPYKPYLPGVDAVRKLGAGWVGGLEPAGWVESDGFRRITEDGLRAGMKNWVKEMGADGRIMVCLGNEPHGARAKVKENVRAYRALYEAAKEVDPRILVVGTSVEPNRDYFEEGYYRYLDAYDFHIYESYTDVRKTIREYKALMKEFGAVKPILSTELGLNSQGQTRHAVACELVKKTVSLFAEGGMSASWFTIQYPDPEGKARGQSGDAHCVFDCKFNRFNPRLDAVALYTMVSAVGGKKYAQEKRYPGGIEAHLFRDTEGRSFEVLWKEGPRQDVSIPLPGVGEVDVVRIDGSRVTLVPKSGAVTLGITSEPLLLFYRDPVGKLADQLGDPGMAVAAGPEGGVFTVRAPAVRLLPPPGWTSSVHPLGGGLLECRVTPPSGTLAREGRVLVEAPDRSGELVVLVKTQ